MNKYTLLILLTTLLTACLPDQDPRRRKFIADELKNRKIKRVTDAQLLGAATSFGKEAVEQLQDQLLNNYDASQPFNCDKARYVKTAITLKYVLTYRLVCQREQAIFEKEQQLLEAYQYNQKNQLELADNLQKIDNNAIIYTSPITLNGQLVGMWTVVLDKKELVKNIN